MIVSYLNYRCSGAFHTVSKLVSSLSTDHTKKSVIILEEKHDGCDIRSVLDKCMNFAKTNAEKQMQQIGW